MVWSLRACRRAAALVGPAPGGYRRLPETPAVLCTRGSACRWAGHGTSADGLRPGGLVGVGALPPRGAPTVCATPLAADGRHGVAVQRTRHREVTAVCTGRARGVPCTPRWSTACGTRCARCPGSMPWGAPPAPRGGGFWAGLRVRGARDGTGALASHGLSLRAEDAPLLWGQGAPPPQSGAHTPPRPPPLCAPVMDRPRGDATGRSRPVPRGSAIVPPPPRGPQTGLWDLGPGPGATSVPEGRRLPWRTIGRESAVLMPARGQRSVVLSLGRARAPPVWPPLALARIAVAHALPHALLCTPGPRLPGALPPARAVQAWPLHADGPDHAAHQRGPIGRRGGGGLPDAGDVFAHRAPLVTLWRGPRRVTLAVPRLGRLLGSRHRAPLRCPWALPRARHAPMRRCHRRVWPRGPRGVQSGGAPVAAAPVAPGPLAPRPVAPGPPPPGAGAPAPAPPAHGAPPPPPDRVLALPGHRVRRHRGPRDDRDRPEKRSAAPRHGVPGDAPRDRRCPSRAVRLSRDRGPRGDRAHPPGGCGAAGAQGRGTAPSAERREPLPAGRRPPAHAPSGRSPCRVDRACGASEHGALAPRRPRRQQQGGAGDATGRGRGAHATPSPAGPAPALDARAAAGVPGPERCGRPGRSRVRRTAHRGAPHAPGWPRRACGARGQRAAGLLPRARDAATPRAPRCAAPRLAAAGAGGARLPPAADQTGRGASGRESAGAHRVVPWRHATCRRARRPPCAHTHHDDGERAVRPLA